MNAAANWASSVAEQRRKLLADLGPDLAPYVGKVFAVSIESETIAAHSPWGSPSRSVGHPYVGPRSWLRCLPEPGANTVIEHRSDAMDVIYRGYVNNTEETKNRNKMWAAGQSLYRPLQPGEMHLVTPGVAQSFWSSRGVNQQAGGLINSALSQPTLEHVSRSPTHKRRLSLSTLDKVSDVEQLGAVRRPNSDRPFAKSDFIKKGDDFAKEYLLVLASKGDVPILSDYRLGNVIEDDGSVATNSQTGKDLRLRHKLFTVGNGETTLEIDEKGNVVVSLDTGAEFGFALSVPGGKFDVDIGKEGKLDIGGNWTHTVQGRFVVDATDVIVLKGSTVHLGGNQASAIEAVIKGTSFVNSVMLPLLTALVTMTAGITGDVTFSAMHTAATGSITAANVTISALLGVVSSTLSNIVKTA